MKSIIKLNIKQLIKLPFIWITFFIPCSCFMMYGIILSKGAAFINYVAQFDCYTYIELVVILSVFCYTVYAYRLNHTAESLCMFTHAERHLSRILSILIVSLVFLLVPVGYVVFSAVFEHTGWRFTAYALLYAVIRWLLLIVASETMALLCIFLVKTPVAFVLSVPSTIILSYMNAGVLRLFPFSLQTQEKISAFLSMQRPFIASINMDYTGARVDGFLVSKLVYVVLGFLLVGVLVWIKYAKKKRVSIIILSVLVFLECFCVNRWLLLFPQEYRSDEKLYSTAVDHQDVCIDTYTGNIKLGELTEITCNVAIRNSGKKNLCFRLDQCFNVDNVTCNEQVIPYLRSGDYISIEFPETIQEEKHVSFQYSGHVYYISDIKGINLFSSWVSTSFPARFAFLPTIESDSDIKSYDFEVQSGNDVVSNLTVSQKSQNQYRVCGSAITFSLFSGFFAEYKENDTTFYRTRYNKLTDYAKTYQDCKDIGYLDGFTGELVTESLPDAKKVFIIYSLYGPYGFPIVYDDYILVNYGTPAQ